MSFFLSNNDETESQSKYIIDDESPRVTMTTKSGKILCDFLCVEHFRLYAVSEERTKIQRLTFFECYFEGYVISCIMDVTSMEKSKTFPAMDMDPQDWGRAKQQIRYWNKVIIPKIEEIPQTTYEYPKEFRIRMKHFENRVFDMKQRKICDYPDVNSPLWKIVTYLHMIQLLPIIPKKQIPGYYLNLVCKNQEEKETFAEKLKIFLEEYYRNDPVLNDMHIFSQILDCQFEETESNAAIPYIVLVDKQNELRQLKSKFNQYVFEIQNRKTHPFRRWIPVLINEHPILDSTAMNVMIKDMDIIDWDVRKYYGIKNAYCRILGSCTWFSKKTARDRMKNIKDLMTGTFEEYAKDKNINSETLETVLKYERNEYLLGIWFGIFCDRELSKSRVHPDTCDWLFLQLQELIKKQIELDTVIDGLMIVFRKIYEELKVDHRPYYEDYEKEEERVFRTEINDQPVLCFHPGYFTEWLKTEAPHVDPEKIQDRFYKQGKLLTRGDSKRICNVSLKCKNKIKNNSPTKRTYITIRME